MFETNYRIWFLKSAARLIIPPFFIAYFIARVYPNTLSVFLAPFIYFSAVLAWLGSLLLYEWVYQRFDARRQGAIMVPEARGRLPGNLDILSRCVVQSSTLALGSADG